MILDPADPINYIYAVENGPVTPAGRESFIQYIEGDLVIPNPTTEALIDAATDRAEGAKELDSYQFTSREGNVPLDKRHGFLIDFQGNPSVTAKAQNQAIGFLETGTVTVPAP
jgi:hypothetical protein